jgi:hypothetical protein
MQQRPKLLDCRAVLGTIKAWPGNAGASGKAIATASLDGPCARRACCTRRPGRRNGRQAQTKEQIDDIAKSRFTRRGLREDETTMEDRSSQHVRILVTQTARSRLNR